MPNEEQNIKHSFSNTYEAGQGPQSSSDKGAGKLETGNSQAPDWLRLEAFWREKKRCRDRKRNRLKSRRFRARRRAEKAIMSAPVHPTLQRADVMALEEVIGGA